MGNDCIRVLRYSRGDTVHIYFVATPLQFRSQITLLHPRNRDGIRGKTSPPFFLNGDFRNQII